MENLRKNERGSQLFIFENLQQLIHTDAKDHRNEFAIDVSEEIYGNRWNKTRTKISRYERDAFAFDRVDNVTRAREQISIERQETNPILTLGPNTSIAPRYRR